MYSRTSIILIPTARVYMYNIKQLGKLLLFQLPWWDGSPAPGPTTPPAPSTRPAFCELTLTLSFRPPRFSDTRELIYWILLVFYRARGTQRSSQITQKHSFFFKVVNNDTRTYELPQAGFHVTQRTLYRVCMGKSRWSC